MEIEVIKGEKLVEIWLTNEEKNDAILREQMADLYEEYKAQKYKVAVFQSGEQSLYQNTENLILHNRSLGM